ncbi:tetratricopeptide repeat protein [candidate division KSB1 bacterium]|nr:tetratricopeptide repeat protein [candidate division KSB1 bacterium]
MNIQFKNKIIIIFVLLFVGLISGINAQESAFVTAVINETGEDLNKLDTIINEHKALLQKYPKGPFASTIMFQLAELYAQRSNLVYQQDMRLYEENIKKYDEGVLAVEPVLPKIDVSNTLNYCNKLLVEFPNSKFKDKILYKIGISYLQTGDKLKAKNYFESIVNNFPESSIVLESHFRIGEYYFEKRDNQNAILHYEKLLGNWDNPYFDMSLYKLGWSYYNMSNYSNAISTFLYLIEDISLLDKVKTQVLSRTKADLRSESIQYIASCFTEYGGPDKAKEFLLQYKEKDYTLPILLSMCELYKKRDYFTEAINTYKVILDIYPYYKNAPDIYQKIIDNYELSEDLEGANKIRDELVNKLGPGSEWLSKNMDAEVKDAGIDISKKSLVYLGTFYQAEAQQSANKEDYQKAIGRYQDYLKKFPDTDESIKILYYLAECYYDIEDFEKAAETYYNVVKKDSLSKSEYREEAAYNRVLCNYQLLNNPELLLEDAYEIPNFLGTGDTLTIKVQHPAQYNFLIACNDFSLTFPKSKWLDQVYLKYGEVLHELKFFLPAVEVYKLVIDLGLDRPYHLLAAMNAGQCYFDAELFHEADIWFSKIVKSYPDSSRFIKKAQMLSSSSKFKIAEQLSQEEKSLEAAELLNSIVNNSVDPQIQERALFESATQYQQAEETTKAAQALEKLYQINPQSGHADEALYKAAELRENNGEWTLAANNFLNLADNYPNSDQARYAMRNAAVCYENLKDWRTAKSIYSRYVDTYPDAGDELLECMYKIGDMYYKLNDFINSATAFDNMIAKYKALSESQMFDTYFVAQAQFMLGEIYFDYYRQIELVPPLETNLKLKVSNFQKVLNAYKNALVYQVADWSTASTHKIGMAFEEFFRAFIESPPPDELEGEQLNLYVNALKEKAQPYKEQALETYKLNIEQANTNNIENSWVDESKKRIQALTPEENINKVDTNNTEKVNVVQETKG